VVIREIEVLFKVIVPGKLRGNGGEALHGWLFKRLQEEDPVASERIHNQQHKPFGLYWVDNVNKEFPIGRKLKCSIFTFSGEDTELITDVCLKGVGRYEKLGQISVVIEGSRVVQSTTFAEIIEKSFANDWEDFKVNFLTPTSFRSQGKQILYPSPELVFRSLFTKWNTFCDERMPKIEIDWADTLWISQYNLQTKSIAFGNYQIVGCIGAVKYVPAHNRRDLFNLKIANAILQFGNFCAVGYKTTMGLGRISY
jgi:CRISPR-associated endoribonuclease Cas6